jgi:hypothetical protein
MDCSVLTSAVLAQAAATTGIPTVLQAVMSLAFPQMEWGTYHGAFDSGADRLQFLHHTRQAQVP